MTIPILDGITQEVITSSRLSSRVLFSGDENGIPVVFVHGNVSSATFWEETMLALPSGYRGIAPDNRGYGGADKEALIDATRGCKDWSDDLASLLDALDIETAHVVGHSLGGAILWQFMMDYPNRIRTATQIAPGSPFGFGGTKGLDGDMCFADSAGSGGGIVSPDFAKAVAENDRSADEQNSPINVMNAFYWKPPFVPERIDDLLSSALSIHTGENRYPGDATASENWPMAAPGKFGPNNALAPLYADDINKLYAIDNKPPVLWVRGDSDQIVSDASFFELGTLGQMGAVPGWPGEDIFPPQPMVGQTRAVLDTYGNYQEVVIADASHSPYIEKPAEFNQAFHAHLQQFDA